MSITLNLMLLIHILLWDREICGCYMNWNICTHCYWILVLLDTLRWTYWISSEYLTQCFCKRIWEYAWLQSQLNCIAWAGITYVSLRFNALFFKKIVPKKTDLEFFARKLHWKWEFFSITLHCWKDKTVLF